jgi:S1-C subfamily serine protease
MVKNARRIVVENKEWGAMEAQTWITNPALDLAILKLDSSASHILKDLPISFSRNTADLGQEVYTLGFPREDLVYGLGSISSLTGFKNDTASYQISIPVNPGNSGGPLFDSNGNLIGVISGRNIKEEGSAFAIKSSEIADYLATLDSNLSFRTVRKNPLSGLKRSDQLKKTQPYVFVVKVYTGTK